MQATELPTIDAKALMVYKLGKFDILQRPIRLLLLSEMGLYCLLMT
jgi:hypothetical protein